MSASMVSPLKNGSGQPFLPALMTPKVGDTALLTAAVSPLETA
jgi:hypothetical protein